MVSELLFGNTTVWENRHIQITKARKGQLRKGRGFKCERWGLTTSDTYQAVLDACHPWHWLVSWEMKEKLQGPPQHTPWSKGACRWRGLCPQIPMVPELGGLVCRAGKMSTEWYCISIETGVQSTPGGRPSQAGTCGGTFPACPGWTPSFVPWEWGGRRLPRELASFGVTPSPSLLSCIFVAFPPLFTAS